MLLIVKIDSIYIWQLLLIIYNRQVWDANWQKQEFEQN